jgi:hypothetical protein
LHPLQRGWILYNIPRLIECCHPEYCDGFLVFLITEGFFASVRMTFTFAFMENQQVGGLLTLVVSRVE